MRKETIGYIEKIRVVPDDEHPGEWLLKGDVYFTCENIDEALKGFSYSFIEIINESELGRDFLIYLPYPYYNDQEVLKYLNKDKSFAIGRWVKKSADPLTVALISVGITIFLTPAWNQIYDELVSPAIKKLLNKIKPLWEKGLTFDLIHILKDSNNNKIQIYFIPDRASRDISLKPEYVKEGIYAVEKYLLNNPDDADKGVKRIKLYFDTVDNKYMIFHIQFLDGNDINIIEKMTNQTN